MYFPQKRGLNVFYVPKLLSPTAVGEAYSATTPLETVGVAAASRAQYFPHFWGGRGVTRTAVYHIPRVILSFIPSVHFNVKLLTSVED